MGISTFLKRKFLKTLFFPSHNRGEALPKEIIKLLKKKPGLWDLPELPEIGTTLTNEGLVSDAQKYFAKEFNVQNCWFGVNGASGLIQSAIVAMANPGDHILVPRNVHTCVIKICTLVNIKPIFFDLPFNESTGHYQPIKPDWLENIFNHQLLKEKEIAGIIFVNPSYQGYASDMEPLIEICHKNKVPVLVDEAHGSYLLYSEGIGLPKSALKCNADLVVHSLHKSLNGLTQTAVLWEGKKNIRNFEIANHINLLQTSSQNSLLLSSCEESINDWLKKDSLKKYKKRIIEAKMIFEKLSKKGIPLVETQDPLKIILNTGIYGIDGFTADQFFYEHGIIAELPEVMTLTFCLGFAKQTNFVNIFLDLWNKLLLRNSQLKKIRNLKPPFKRVQIPEISPSVAWRQCSVEVPIKESLGLISADIICPYPPGIPLIIPGEKIDSKRIDWLLEQSLYNRSLLNSNVKVIKNLK